MNKILFITLVIISLFVLRLFVAYAYYVWLDKYHRRGSVELARDKSSLSNPRDKTHKGRFVNKNDLSSTSGSPSEREIETPSGGKVSLFNFIKGLTIINILYGLFFLTGVFISKMPWEILGLGYFITNIVIICAFRRGLK